MKTIILISCVSKKLATRAKARNLYNSSLFKFNLHFALSLNPDNIYVISAKYGLVGIEDEIEPYDLTLNTMGVAERKNWAKRVISQLAAVSDLNSDKFIFLAGDRYRQFLVPHITHYEIPMEGKPIGMQLQFLKGKISS